MGQRPGGSCQLQLGRPHGSRNRCSRSQVGIELPHEQACGEVITRPQCGNDVPASGIHETTDESGQSACMVEGTVTRAEDYKLGFQIQTHDFTGVKDAVFTLAALQIEQDT